MPFKHALHTVVMIKELIFRILYIFLFNFKCIIKKSTKIKEKFKTMQVLICIPRQGGWFLYVFFIIFLLENGVGVHDTGWSVHCYFYELHFNIICHMKIQYIYDIHKCLYIYIFIYDYTYKLSCFFCFVEVVVCNK